MDSSTYLGDIDSDPVEDNRCLLQIFALIAIVASGLHWHTTNYASCTVDLVFGILMLVFVSRPTWLALTAMMAFSLTQCCASILLLGAGLIYENIIWSHEPLKNIPILAYSVDILYSAVIFFILNIAWETPSKGYMLNEEHEINDDDEHEDIWAPFAGTGKVIAEYQIQVPDLEKQHDGLKSEPSSTQ